jgi:hypothetical protein
MKDFNDFLKNFPTEEIDKKVNAYLDSKELETLDPKVHDLFYALHHATSIRNNETLRQYHIWLNQE